MVRSAVVALLAVLVAGCETPGPKPAPATPAPVATPEPKPAPAATPAAKPPAPPPVAPAKPAGEIAFEQGQALYDAGDFNAAIKHLQDAREIWDGPAPGLKLRAHKLIAFSYCVTNRRAQCRAQFVEALKLDPNFVLEPAERTHPIWNGEYEAAKKSLAQPADDKKAAPKPTPKPPAKPAPVKPAAKPAS